MTFRYSALGFDISSAFACPGFRPFRLGDAVAGRAIRLEIGAVPARLDRPVTNRPLLQIDARGTCLHHVPGIARFLLRDRHLVTVDPAPGASPERVSLVLRGAPMAVLCGQWGLLPLAAAAVASGDRALVIAGGPASGKSVLAMHLAARGYRFLADALCAFEPGDAGPPRLWSSFPETCLWPDALAALGLARDAGSPVGRTALGVDMGDGAAAVRPVAMLVLDARNDDRLPEIARCRGVAALKTTIAQIWQQDLMRVLQPERHPILATGLAASVPVFEQGRPQGFAHLDRWADTIGEMLESLSPASELQGDHAIRQ